MVGMTPQVKKTDKKQHPSYYRGATMPAQHQEPESLPDQVNGSQTEAAVKGKVITYRGQKMVL
jgi:hypothetical protein